MKEILESVAAASGLFDFTGAAHDEFVKSPGLLDDGRLSDVIHTYTVFTPHRYESLAVWEKRKSELIKRIRISAGLWPMPKRGDLNARVFDRRDFGDFTVEKVLFESYPGFFVTGNLYRPLGKTGPLPAILNPHGHWDNGRLERSDHCDVPLRCANFAKMGFIAFAYDMVGYLDSKQVSHTYGGYRQDLWNIGAFGLQLWNSIRAVDFLETLPEVDKDRIGCTGASGDGTQTFFLTAVDSRIKAAVPVNMVSTYMQGGCNCENAPGLRIGTNNVELAALIAPVPMLLIGSTGDWTRDLPTVDFPAIHDIYDLYGASDRLDYFYHEAGHNYNKKAREKVYRWFAKHLAGVTLEWREQDVDFGDVEELRIFPGELKPEGIHSNRELFEVQKKERLATFKAVWDSGDTCTREMLHDALRQALGIYGQIRENRKTYECTVQASGCIVEKFILTASGKEQIPACLIRRESSVHSKKVILVLHPDGKKAALTYHDAAEFMADALETGHCLASADLFLTGEYHRPFSRTGRDSRSTQHFTTFNYSDDALRVQDVVTVCDFLASQGFKEVFLVGLQEAGLWCMAALPFLHGVIGAAMDMTHFTLYSEDRLLERFCVPGFFGAGGFETCMRLSRVDRVIFFNTAGNPDVRVIREVCENTGKKGFLTVHEACCLRGVPPWI